MSRAGACMISFCTPMLALLVVALAPQPDPAMLRRLFEEALARRERQYGMEDARTARAARDLGMFLAREGDGVGARKPLAEAVKIDETAFGPSGEQTLSDVAELARVSNGGEAAALWQRASEAKDAGVAVHALM